MDVSESIVLTALLVVLVFGAGLLPSSSPAIPGAAFKAVISLDQGNDGNGRRRFIDDGIDVVLKDFFSLKILLFGSVEGLVKSFVVDRLACATHECTFPSIQANRTTAAKSTPCHRSGRQGKAIAEMGWSG